MDIRCENCKTLIAKAEDSTEVIGAITIKCNKCNFMNIIKGVIKVIEDL